MPIILALLFILLAFGVLCLFAFIVSIAVPALLLDPSNWWAWLWLLAVLGSLFGAGSAASKN